MALKLNIGGDENERAGVKAPARIGSAVEGLSGGLLRPGISPQRGACLQPAQLLGRRIGDFVGFAQTVTAEQEDLGVLDEPVGDGGSDGGVEKDVAQSENGVLVVMIVERFWLCRVEITW